jgi:hypothetical protein
MMIMKIEGGVIMSLELKQKWVDALRSGEYRQSKCGLRTPDGFCCLGVLCDIVDPNGWRKTNVGAYSHPLGTWDGFLISISKLGMPGIPNQYVLAEKNDSEDWTFDQIADYIETYDSPAVETEKGGDDVAF